MWDYRKKDAGNQPGIRWVACIVAIPQPGKGDRVERRTPALAGNGWQFRCGLAFRAHEQQRPVDAVKDTRRHAAIEDPRQAGKTMAGHGNQIYLLAVGDVDDGAD